MAQSVSPQMYSDMKWRLIGPFRAGRVVAVSGIPGDNTTFYFGAVDGGVWKTTNAGTTWKPIFDKEPVASIGALAVAPSNPQSDLCRDRRERHTFRSRLREWSLQVHRWRRYVAKRSGSKTLARSARSSSTRPIPILFMSARWATPMGRMRSAGSISPPTVE